MFDMVSFFDDKYTVEDIDGNVVLQLPVPGLTKEDLEIEASPNALDIKVTANRKLPFLSKKRWRFNHRLGNAEVYAKVENGVLTVTMSETGKTRYRVEVV